jgi:hypothetical protein
VWWTFLADDGSVCVGFELACRPCAPVHCAQRHLLIFCYSRKNETHDVHSAIVSIRYHADQSLHVRCGSARINVSDTNRDKM